MATVTTPIATDATLSSGLTAIKNAIADTRGTTSMQCDNSDSWSSSTTYAVGKTVIYDNKVWECLVQNNGQTPSGTSTYWKQVTLSSLNSSNIKISERTYTDVTLTADSSGLAYFNLTLLRHQGIILQINPSITCFTQVYSSGKSYGQFVVFRDIKTLEIIKDVTISFTMKYIDLM